MKMTTTVRHLVLSLTPRAHYQNLPTRAKPNMHRETARTAADLVGVLGPVPKNRSLVRTCSVELASIIR